MSDLGSTKTELAMLPGGTAETVCEIAQPEAAVLQHYPGAKANSGIAQFLINRIPFHQRYHEICAGSAQLFRAKRPAAENYLVDIDPQVSAALQQQFPDAKVFNEGALDYLEASRLYAGADFVYLDPPYNEDARRSSRPLYRYEMLKDEEHTTLLTALRSLDAMVMISTRQNQLYDMLLSDWRKEVFNTVDRGGPVQEIIYMNYPPPLYLHQYDYLGEGYIDRQRIKRKTKERFTDKLLKLPAYEKHLFIQQLIENDAAAVQHFLTVRDLKR